MVNPEGEPLAVVWGRSLQRGRGVEGQVQGGFAGSLLSIFIQNGAKS